MTGLQVATQQRLLSVLVVAALFCGVDASARQVGKRLADVLAECGCIVDGMPPELLRTEVVAASHFVDSQGFVVAFYSDPSDSPSSVGVVAGSVASRAWKRVDLPLNADSRDPRDLVGPIWEIRRLAGFILIGLRVAIDGIATSVLSPDLTRRAVTYGRVHAILPSGLVVYERAQPHFAPTHYLRLAALEPVSGREREILPTRPYGRVRREMIERERRRYAALGETWCRTQNHHCDPELFDSDMSWPAEVAVNESTKAMAFGVDYGDGVITVCEGIDRLDRIACRETPLSAWRRAFPNDNGSSLIGRAAANPRRVSGR